MAELRDYASVTGLAVTGEVQEVGGATSPLPRLRELQRRAGRREYDALVVVRLDRLGRRVDDLVRCYSQLERCGVDVHVLSPRITPDTPGRPLLLSVLAGFAEMEHQYIRERTRAAMNRPGANRGGRRTLVTEALEARVLCLCRDGASYRRIATELRVSKSLVGAIVQRRGGAEAVRGAVS